MKILITGATGFLGSHLVPRLIKEGHDVRILKEKNDPGDLLKGLNIEVVLGDIRDGKAVKAAVKGSEVVFHLVGIVSYWSKLNDLQYEVNVRGTKNVVEACLEYKIKRLIHVSSDVTVGVEGENKLANEETPYNLFPLRVNYCDTKFLGEMEVYKGIAKGLDAVILCPASMYGERDRRKIKTDMTFNFKFPMNLFYMKGGIAVVDVEDVVEGLIKAWERGKRGERYLLIGENLTFYEMRKIISEVLGKKPPIFCFPSWLLTLLSYLFVGISKITKKRPKLTPEMARFNKIEFYFSNEKAERELGLKFRPFKDSIKRAIKWYKGHGFL